ncbi:MAG: hypothetical protein KAG43_04985 [Candidatus Marithrix sp.]|nr:hypothetical protein [Candidatus Marithrix sp.]
MEEQKAVHYGQLELIPGIICDVYILNNGTPVMSLRGAADLLGMKHVSLRSMVATWPPKTLKPFINKAHIMVATLAKVEAKNSPYLGRNIVVYDSKMIATIISTYVMAAGHNALQKNQLHIGKRCSILVPALITTTLDTAIEQICGLNPNIEATAQKTYADVAKLMKDTGFNCSIAGDIATKKDMVNYFEVPLSNTSDSFYNILLLK